MGRIIVNGVEYQGNNVSVNGNGIVIIDGKSYPQESKEIYVSVMGDIDILSLGSCEKIEITGNVSDVHNGSGTLKIGGDVKSVKSGSGDVHIQGSVNSVQTGSGDVYRN